MARTYIQRDRLRQRYSVHGQPYQIFRETVIKKPVSGKDVTLVVGFRLKVLRSSTALHWLFQRFCIVTTPFWSGTVGFRDKLWMVDPETKNYIGIYDWAERENAERYVSGLERILRVLSVRGTVWHNLYNEPFEHYLHHHELTDARRPKWQIAKQ